MKGGQCGHIHAHTHFDKCILTCQTLSDLILWQTAIVPFRNENK